MPSLARAQQLNLIEDVVPPADLVADPGADYGEVFTRRWVVEFILDLAGYTPDKDLGARTLIEPSCGTGAFLVPVVQRLLTSAAEHGRDPQTLAPAIRAFDLLDANTELARKAVTELLLADGLTHDEAVTLTGTWLTTGDFLFQSIESASADFVVGNPPYLRLENVPRRVMDTYRRICSTMRGRADVYVGFIERGLELLKPGAVLAFICADRWMRNQYGADLRQLVTSRYAVDTVVSMHDVDAFEDDVSAYPAIVVLRNQNQAKTAVVDAKATFNATDAAGLARWVRRGRRSLVEEHSYDATRVDGWFNGRDLWPTGSPLRLALIADLESRFAPLQDVTTGTRVGIGVATGCDDVFITSDPELVETDRLLPLLRSPDITNGTPNWSGRYLVNPWDDTGLVRLEDHPRLARYLQANRGRLRARHVAKQRPRAWYRTIDRIDHELTARPKLLVPDLKVAAHPVLETGSYYPHHNLYYVISDVWDPEVLGGLLLSDVANLFVGAYCVRMRGGTYRFQAQYLRRIRVPDPRLMAIGHRRALAQAFAARDRERATAVAAEIYGLSDSGLF